MTAIHFVWSRPLNNIRLKKDAKIRIASLRVDSRALSPHIPPPDVRHTHTHTLTDRSLSGCARGQATLAKSLCGKKEEETSISAHYTDASMTSSNMKTRKKHQPPPPPLSSLSRDSLPFATLTCGSIAHKGARRAKHKAPFKPHYYVAPRPNAQETARAINAAHDMTERQSYEELFATKTAAFPPSHRGHKHDGERGEGYACPRRIEFCLPMTTAAAATVVHPRRHHFFSSLLPLSSRQCLLHDGAWCNQIQGRKAIAHRRRGAALTATPLCGTRSRAEPTLPLSLSFCYYAIL